MPRNFDNATIICNRKKAPCYEKVLYNIAHSMDEKYSCNYCLPACFEINYGREISSSKLGTGGFVTAELLPSNDTDYIRDNLAIIHIFLTDNAYGGFTKSELIGFTEFLSNTGGLLGLFMGFSVISLIEIIYFLSLRPYCVQKRAADEQQTTANENLQIHSRHFNAGFKGANNNKLMFGGQPVPTVLNEYYQARGEAQQQKSLCQRLHSGLISSFRYIKAKLASGWSGLVALFYEQKDEDQPPFPYYNWNTICEQCWEPFHRAVLEASFRDWTDAFYCSIYVHQTHALNLIARCFLCLWCSCKNSMNKKTCRKSTFRSFTSLLHTKWNNLLFRSWTKANICQLQLVQSIAVNETLFGVLRASAVAFYLPDKPERNISNIRIFIEIRIVWNRTKNSWQKVEIF